MNAGQARAHRRDHWARTCAVSLALAAALAAGLALTAPPAAAQTFFAESDALRADSAIELTFSDLTDDTRTDSTVGSTFDNVDASLRRLEGRLRAGYLALGAMAQGRKFLEETDLFTQRDERREGAGYGALVFEELLTGNDALFVVLSAGKHEEEFAYQTYLRQLDATVRAQGGLVYRIAFLIGGYIRGKEELRLQVTDPLMPAVDERYEFNYTAWLAGLLFGDPNDIGALLVFQRKNTPDVPGMAVDLERGFEQLHRASIGLRLLRLDYTQTHVLEAFSDSTRRDSRERDIALGARIGERLVVSVSERRTVDEQGFSLLGISTTQTTERTEHLLRISFRF